MYLIVDSASKACAAVDPIEPDKILATVRKHGLTLTSILTTHHHADHASGNPKLVQMWKAEHGTDLAVYGGDQRIDALSNQVSDGTQLRIGSRLHVHCLHTPCHTKGHICYHVTEEGGDASSGGAVFTGDTLFLGGCGRFFEGSAKDMYKALIECLAKLPKATKVYCGHEYTVKNLEFGLTVEPRNEAIKSRLAKARNARAHNEPTVPGTIEEELQTNPFMRVGEPDVLSYAQTNDPVEAMRVVRVAKDTF